MLPHCAAAGGSTQTMRHNGSCSPSWILAVSDKFSFVGCCRMVSRKEGEDELPDLENFHIILGQGRIFGRCCKIAVSSEDGKRRLFAIFMSIITKKVTPKSAG